MSYTTIFPTDRKSGLPEAARTPSWIWSGTEIGAEMKWGVEELRGRLASVGADFADIVDYTVFLTDAGDLTFEEGEPGEVARARIEAAVERLASSGLRPLSLGGDHSIM